MTAFPVRLSNLLPVFLATLVASGCRNAPPEGPRVEAKPTLIAETDRRHHFGTVVSRPGRTASHSYRLVNTTANVVNLLNVINRKTCCGSVRAEKLRLGCGEAADVEVTLHLDNRFGDVVNVVEVVTDLPSDERVELRTSATAVMFLRVEPVSLPQGPILAGTDVASRATFQVFAAGDADEPPIDLNRIALRSTIPVEWAGPKQECPSEDGLTIESRVFRTTMDAAGLPGNRRAEILLQMEKESDVLLRHVVDWRVIPPVSVAPEMIVLKSGDHEYRVVLKSQDKAAFRVTGVACGDQGVHGLAASSDPAPTQVVVVKGTPKPGAKRGVVAISTDHPASGKIKVPYTVLD
jgi:hypothetical protein